VTLVTGPLTEPYPADIRTIRVLTTAEMLAAVKQLVVDADILFMAAAPADFRPLKVARDKRKEERLSLEFVRTPDILTELHALKLKALLVGFSLETRDLVTNARNKLKAKGLDLIVANPVQTVDSDAIKATLLFRAGRPRSLKSLPKPEFARLLVAEAARLLNRPARGSRRQ